LRQFQAGCTRLLEAPHDNLDAPTRDWLRKRCQAWSEKIGELEAKLERDRDVAAVRQAANATVERLSAALREKAAEVARG
jgi:hypothetical protein